MVGREMYCFTRKRWKLNDKILSTEKCMVLYEDDWISRISMIHEEMHGFKKTTKFKE